MRRSNATKIALFSIIAIGLILGGILQTSIANAKPWNSQGRRHWQINPTPTPIINPTPTPTASPTPSVSTQSTPAPLPIQTPTPTPIPTTTATPSPSPQASIQIYSDQSCTTALSSINWGALSPGATSTLVLYVRNQGNTAITLSKALSNWSPTTLSTYLTPSWDYTNQALNPGTTLKVTLSFAVSPSISSITNFGFSTTINPQG